MKTLVKAEGLGKTFISQPVTTKRLHLADFVWRTRRCDPLWALRNVSFEVEAGEMMGIVGANGAGKSTLLRLLGGIGKPSTGTLQMNGRIGALLDLGGGFQGDLTGKENTILSAVVAGLLKQEAIEILPEIIRFAEMEKFIDAPVRTYSTGMLMRLAFSVAVHTSPEIMLVDEYLAVGDLAFQAKCNTRIAKLRKAGCAIVLVSHSMDQIREQCDRALWLRQGMLIACDDAKAVATHYEQEMRLDSIRRTPENSTRTTKAGAKLFPKKNRFGSMEMEITDVILHPGHVIGCGDPLGIEIRYRCQSALNSPIFSISITRPDGSVCLDINTQSAQVPITQVNGDGSIRLNINRLDIAAGSYFVNVGVFEASWSHAYDFHWHAYQLLVEGGSSHKGILAPPCRWEMDLA
jgi:lipopolysaccharide transport system ATP-binding protein